MMAMTDAEINALWEANPTATALVVERGHVVLTAEGRKWYADDHSDAKVERPCVACGQTTDPEDRDGEGQCADRCLGMIPGVRFACCGHGWTDAFGPYVMLDDESTLEGDDALRWFAAAGVGPWATEDA